MNRKLIIRLGLAALTAMVLASCEKMPTDPGGDGGGTDTTSTGKNIVQQVVDALS